MQIFLQSYTGYIDSLNILNKTLAGFQTVLLVVDEHVYTIHQQYLRSQFFEPNYIWHTVPRSELCKTRAEKEKIEDILIRANALKNTCLVAIGGGAVSDLVGYVASGYMRGVSFINVPTTLLATVDATIGGKCAINVNGYKNILGVFYNPKLILIDPVLLKSLSVFLITQGWSEIIKHGFLMGQVQLEQVFNSLQNGLNDYEHLIESQLQFKDKIVSKDPFESNIRRGLNFGHTVGHALESISDFKISHGEAIALGLYMESFILQMNRQIEVSFFNLICDCLNLLEIECDPQYLDAERLWEIMAYDKKNLASKTPLITYLNDYTLKTHIIDPKHLDLVCKYMISTRKFVSR